MALSRGFVPVAGGSTYDAIAVMLAEVIRHEDLTSTLSTSTHCVQAALGWEVHGGVDADGEALFVLVNPECDLVLHLWR